LFYKLNRHIQEIAGFDSISNFYSPHYDYKNIIDIIDNSFSNENRTNKYFKFKNNMGKLMRGWGGDLTPAIILL
jgi:hypothetical protein